MRLTTSLATASLVLGGLGSLTACGDGDDPAATVPLSASTSPSVAPSSAAPSPSAAGAEATAYPEIGLTFADLPQLSGPQQDAVRTWMDFEVAVRRTTTTLKLDPAIGRIDAEMVPDAKAAISYLKEHHQRHGGKEEVRFLKMVGARGNIVVFDTCLDLTQGWLESTNGGEREPVDPATEKVRVEMNQVMGAWKISSHETVGTC